MNLKTKCDEFLQSILAMRDSEVSQAIQQELQTKHEPYKAQMISVRDTALANEEQAFRTLIEQITKEHNAKVEAVKEDFGKAIQKHRDELACYAKARTEAKYNKFIIGVSTVADEIEVN